jgi:hypothetical protein
MTLLLVRWCIFNVYEATMNNLFYIKYTPCYPEADWKVIFKVSNRLFEIHMPACEVYRPASPDKCVKIRLLPEQ